MKKILLIFFIIILSSISISWYNSTPRVIASRLIKKDDIKTGQLRYKIYLFKIFPIGEAVLKSPEVTEYNGKKVYHLNASANNSRFFAQFVNVYAILDSYIDIQQLNPMLFKQKLVVTDRKDIYREVFYDQQNHIMSIAGVRRQILPDTQDPLSAIFNIRRADFDRVKDFEISINTNQKNYVLRGTAEPRNISVEKKIYKIAFLKANISRRDKNPYHKSSMSMILLSERGNIPILINVFTKGIFINVRLIEIQ